MKKVKWSGFLRLFPIRRGTIKKGKKIWLINIKNEEKWLGGVVVDDYITSFITEDIRGKITNVEETVGGIKVEAEFPPLIKKRVDRRVMLRLILNNIDLHKENMKKVLAKLLYYNFNIEELEKMSKSKIFFKRPKLFEKSWYGEKIYLKFKNKYYEI